MSLTLIAAISENNVIGVNGKLPWRIKEDMARFKALTTGHPVIMGRKTYTSIPEKFRPLPGRENIILTRDESFSEPGIYTAHSIDEAVNIASNYNPPVFVIGGREVYKAFLPLANRMEITRVHANFIGDADFPMINWNDWLNVHEERHTGVGGIDYSFLSYTRK